MSKTLPKKQSKIWRMQNASRISEKQKLDRKLRPDYYKILDKRYNDKKREWRKTYNKEYAKKINCRFQKEERRIIRKIENIMQNIIKII